MELLEKQFLKPNVLSLCRFNQLLSVVNEIKIQKGTSFKWNDLLRLVVRVRSKKSFKPYTFKQVDGF